MEEESEQVKIKIRKRADLKPARPWLADCRTCKVRALRTHSLQDLPYFAWRATWAEALTWTAVHFKDQHRERS